MKGKELRIGNWVRLHENEFQVNTSGINAAHHLEPIPLTEEWLERFGFEKLNHQSKTWYQTKTYKGDYNFDIAIRGEYVSLNHGLRTIKLGKMKVHQLQNLCFALTGEELTIKEMA
jgi:hypothetical protein